jgi:hypothetical protein
VFGIPVLATAWRCAHLTKILLLTELIVPTPAQIVAFQAENPEPLVIIPPEHADDFKAGRSGVLVPPLQITDGDDFVFEGIGFVEHENEALKLLRERIIDLLAVQPLDVFYYSGDMWPPKKGTAFGPRIAAMHMP